MNPANLIKATVAAVLLIGLLAAGASAASAGDLVLGLDVRLGSGGGIVARGDGVWFPEVELPPGRHDYLFVADATWRPDPATETVPNPFGSGNSVVTVGSASSN